MKMVEKTAEQVYEALDKAERDWRESLWAKREAEEQMRDTLIKENMLWCLRINRRALYSQFRRKG